MFRFSIRSLLAKRLRLLTTALAIVLGVAFTTGTLILTDTMTKSFESTIDDIGSGVDTVVRGPEITSRGGFTQRAAVPISTLATVRATSGVATAVPYWEGYAQVIGADGKALDAQQSVGLNWIADTRLSLFTLTAGSGPVGDGEIVLLDETAKDAGLHIGDTVDVITTAGPEPFVLVGLAELSGGSSLGNTSFVLFDDADADGRLSERGTVDSIFVRGDGTADQATLSRRIAATTTDLEVLTGAERVAEQKSDVSDSLGIFETVLLVFGGIALFVGSFTIANTFSITLAQRTRELALVRAMGASRRQVTCSVLVEALALGLLSSLLGLLAGLGVAKALTAVFSAIGLEFPAIPLVVQPSVIVVGLVAGVLVTLVAALLPARRAAKVPPVAAMRDSAIDTASSSRKRAFIGTVLAAAAGGALAAGIAAESAAIVGLGSLLAFQAAITLGPIMIRPVTAVIGWPLRRLGVSGRLAAANASRNPKRSAATAAALTIGVMLVAGASLFATTAKATIRGDVDQVIVADRVLRPLGTSPGLPSSVASTATAVPGATVVPVRTMVADIDGSATNLTAVDLARTDGLLAIEILEGTRGDERSVIVGDQLAADRSWSVGQNVTVTFPNGMRAESTIAGVFDQTMALDPVIAPYALGVAGSDDLDQLVLVSGSTKVLDAVDAALADVPTVVSETAGDFAATRSGSLDMILSLVLGFLGLAVVIAVLGIAGTIGLAVHERTRELGMLRAVGMSRRQLRTAIRLESVVIAAFGTVVGLALGLGLTWALLGTMADDGFAAPVLPVGLVSVIAAGAVIAGVLAAALPARRAARTPVLDAIRSA